MPAITGTDITGLQASLVPAAAKLSELPATPAPSNRSDQPAVIVSLNSSSASAPASTNLPSLDPNKVDDALYLASGANGFADAAKHFAYQHILAKFGKTIADQDLAGVIGGAANSAAYALSYASSLGIPIQDSVSPEAVKNGAAPGTISVGAFSFTNGGSTYTVTPGKGGTLVGTKDGQAWETWQLDQSGATAGDAGAAAALKTLAALNEASGTGGKPLPLDISA